MSKVNNVAALNTRQFDRFTPDGNNKWHGFKCSVEYMICSAKLNIKKSVNWMNAE
jgi:hypothetical protein